MIGIKDIAKKVGMSPATVSRVINGKKHVNPQRREQILKLIEETGYVPNKAARSMVLQRSYTVGIVIPTTFNIFQRQLFSIMEKRLESFGYYTLFLFVNFNTESETECLNRLKAEKLDGFIMIHEIKSPYFYEYLESVNLPVVTATFRYGSIPGIHVDEEKAAFEAINHLVNLGHRKINLLVGGDFSFSKQRMEGYYKALGAAGIERDERRVFLARQYTMEYGINAMREMLLRGRDFTALFAATDELAIGAIRALRDEGVRVPEDVSVIGFDDIEIANYTVPRLTTIHQPITEIGEETALALHRQINGSNPVKQDRTLSYQLSIRESTARVP
ncbi:MAG: LacI family transcriptional regulator [Treponema sp.]|jgi:LacI family transcriptional regulator|nr:LacI family transcriptional regulator [Treponema sp.]